MAIIHYSAASRCCMPSLHRASPSRSVLAPSIFFFRDAAPTLRLDVSVRSQPPGSDGFGEPINNKHASRDASVGLSASSSSSVIDFLTLCHRLKVTSQTQQPFTFPSIFPMKFYDRLCSIIYLIMELPIYPLLWKRNIVKTCEGKI